MDLQIRLPALNLMRDRATFNAAHVAFGISVDDLSYAMNKGIDLQVKCTDAQFGQFIALRVTGGCQNNQIRVFNVRILNGCLRPAPVCKFNPNIDAR